MHFEIFLGIECRTGISLFASSVVQVMPQRIDSGCRNIRVIVQVPIGIEVGIWVPAFGSAALKIMHQWIDPCCLYVRILTKVPWFIEQPRFPDQTQIA